MKHVAMLLPDSRDEQFGAPGSCGRWLVDELRKCRCCVAGG